MKFTNVSGEHRDLPTLGLLGIPPGEEIEVTGKAAEGLLTDPAFKRVGKPADKSDDKPAKTEEK